MRHGKRFNHLGRKTGHRKAMLANMACSLIEHKRINTTLAKAKALKQYVEPLLTKSKADSTHSRRVVFSYLKSKEAVTELFREVAPKIADRNGGYTRIIRTGYRLGDSAEMCMLELVDFNDIYGTEEKKAGKGRTRRGGAKKKTDSDVASVTDKVESAKDTATEAAVETAAEDTAEKVEDVAEDLSADASTDEAEGSDSEEKKEA
jgi:large subunit ribosomal protein L17